MQALTHSLKAFWAGLLEVWTAHPVLIASLLISSLYAIGIIAARWLLVARPSRRYLESWLDGVQSQLKHAEASHPSDPAVVGARELLDKAVKHLERRTRFGWFSWSGENEIAAWRDVHNAERMLIATWSEARIRTRLAEALPKLKALPQGTSTSGAANSQSEDLVSLIRETLKQSPKDPERERFLLEQALDTLYSEDDSEFWETTNRYGKTMWMAGSALLLILALVFSVGYPVFFLAGAVGGFMSRLSRAVKADKATEDDDMWTTLFLSPLLGALTGWSGMLLIRLGTDLGVLGDAFKRIPWEAKGSVVPLAAAFVFGFSERFFYGMLSKVEGSTDEKKADAGKVDAGKADAGKADAGKADAGKADGGKVDVVMVAPRPDPSPGASAPVAPQSEAR